MPKIAPGIPASFEPTIEAPKRALFGVRSCDIRGIYHLDRFYLGRDFKDIYHEQKRNNLFLVNFVCTLSPQRIILGGGVMDQQQLFPWIRTKVQELLADYVRADAILAGIDNYIVAPGLGNRSGVLGAIALAQRQLGAGVG